MLETDLDLEVLLARISQRWLELTGEAMPPGSLEWAYRNVLALIASWVKIDVELQNKEALANYAIELQKLPFQGARKAAIIALAKSYVDVADVNVNNPSGNRIDVFLLAKTGTPTAGQISGLQTYLNSERVKTMCDTYFVAAASEIVWNFSARITPAGDRAGAIAAATAAITNYGLERQKSLGLSVKPAEIITLLMNLPEVTNIALNSPNIDINATPGQFLKLNNITIAT